MDPATWGFIGVIAGSIIGALTSIVTTNINSRNAARLQRNTDSMDRIERSRVFQRDNMLELQEAFQNALRLTVRAYHEDLASYVEGEPWMTNLSEELDQGTRLSNGKMSILLERVADDDLRSTLRQMHQQIARAPFADSDEEAKNNLKNATKNYGVEMEQLGEALRNHY